MGFNTIDEAWMFWISYGGKKGFEVRKRYTNKRKSDGKISSCRFVCANEGHRLPDKRDRLKKCPRAETRTNCAVHMGLVVAEKNSVVFDYLILLYLKEQETVAKKRGKKKKKVSKVCSNKKTYLVTKKIQLYFIIWVSFI
jgi:hypothetical protein